MPEPIELKVHVAYDEEARCWYVAASDVPGLRLEAETAPELMERIEAAACELIELNQDEILERHIPKERPKVAVTPVFDSPLQLAPAC